jgi:tRNA (Thr-GGU) A37 N-methylase
MWYCSKECQKVDWKTHVFTCRVKDRPNTIDYLRLIIRRLKPMVLGADLEAAQNALLLLFSDDDMCRTF